jgi:ankyrin repeat protein
VEFLLRCGVRADAPLSGDGETGLHWSAVGGYPEIVRMLLTRGADVNARESGYGATPVGWAVYGFGITTERRKGNNFMKW